MVVQSKKSFLLQPPLAHPLALCYNQAEGQSQWVPQLRTHSVPPCDIFEHLSQLGWYLENQGSHPPYLCYSQTEKAKLIGSSHIPLSVGFFNNCFNQEALGLSTTARQRSKA